MDILTGNQAVFEAGYGFSFKTMSVLKGCNKMRVIHCSQKLLKEITGHTNDDHAIPKDNSGLGNWYSEIFKFNKKKYLIFTNEETLFSFFVYSVNKHEIENISTLFAEDLRIYMREIVKEEERINRIIGEYKEVYYCKADDSRVSEAMEFFIKIFESRLEFIDEITDREILIANIQVNTTPMAALNYASPLRKFKELIDQKYPPN